MNSTGEARLTIAGMALLVFVASALLHEGLGHGGACLALGGRPVSWGAFYFDCAAPNLVAERWIAAAGSTVNLAVALIALVMLRMERGASADLFWWLLATVNAFQWAGYFAFSGLAGIGDWGSDGVLRGVDHALWWRLGEAVGGAGLYFGAGLLSARLLGSILGGTDERILLARRLSWTAYAVGGAMAVLIGLLNPVGIFIVLASAAASTLGGASGLMWLTGRMPRNGRAPALDPMNPRPWLIAGVLAAEVLAAGLGRSWRF